MKILIIVVGTFRSIWKLMLVNSGKFLSTQVPYIPIVIPGRFSSKQNWQVARWQFLTKLAGSALAGLGEPANFVFCGISLSKIVTFDCLGGKSTSFSFNIYSINFRLALKKFLVAPLVRLSSHHPKLAVIISCHTNKTIYVLSCTKVALELLHCCCAVQLHAVPQHPALRCVLWNQYGMENHLR